jgi:hypothetical protein
MWHSSWRFVALDVVFKERLRSMQPYHKATTSPTIRFLPSPSFSFISLWISHLVKPTSLEHV